MHARGKVRSPRLEVAEWESHAVFPNRPCVCVPGSVIHPTKMFSGMVAVSLAFGLFFYLTNNKTPAAHFKKNHPLLSLLGVVLAAYFMVYLLGSVLVFLMGILLPITGMCPLTHSLPGLILLTDLLIYTTPVIHLYMVVLWSCFLHYKKTAYPRSLTYPTISEVISVQAFLFFPSWVSCCPSMVGCGLMTE